MRDYLADPGLSASQLKKILMSPADFKAAKEKESEETKQTIRGTAVHTFLLEPHKFHEQYALQPEDYGAKNKGDGKKKWDSFKKTNAHKICLGYEDTLFFESLKKSVHSHTPFHELTLKPGIVVETSQFWEDPLYGRMKCRPDLWDYHDGIIWDLKTTSKDIDDSSLSKTIFFMTYHFQAAHYLYIMRKLGYPIKGYGWIFVSTDTPYPHIIMRTASKEFLNAGKIDHRHALDLYKHCLETENWYGLDSQVQEIHLPQFAERIYS